jgi:hypothetical protein
LVVRWRRMASASIVKVIVGLSLRPPKRLTQINTLPLAVAYKRTLIWRESHEHAN